MSEQIPNPVNEPLKNVEVAPSRPIPTHAGSPAGRLSADGADVPAAAQGAQAVEMPAGLVAAADKSAAVDALKEQLEEIEAAVEGDSFKNRIWTPILSPIVTLAVICIVVSLLLGLTNNITAPMIAANASAAAEQARIELLPEADGFAELPIEVDAPNVTAAYAATNGTGYVVEAFGKGYGGNVPAMIAFDEAGNIKGVTFLSNNETPGLGAELVTDGAFSGQFAGRPAQPVALQDIDTIASATISSNAALTAINSAVDFYNEQIAGMAPVPDAGAGATENTGEG